MIKTINNTIAARRAENEQNDKGFTLIELLVVVLIIGILAAIAIPAFLSQREGAWVSAVESDLKNASLAAETYATKEGGGYTGLDLADLKLNGYNQSEDVTDPVVTVTGNTYTIAAGNSNITGRTFTYSSTTGTIADSATPVTPAD